MRLLYFINLILFCLLSRAQLKNTTYPKPKDSDSIRVYLHSNKIGEEPGPKKRSRLPFFKLYGLNKDSLDIRSELAKGKPVLIINGSYTCPPYRDQILFFDSVSTAFKNELSVFVIYTIEAHPASPDICPFTGEVWVSQRNIAESVNFRQPKTFGERKWIAKQMVFNLGIKVPVFLDTPDNEWLQAFGPLTNMAYLIDADGIIISKYPDYSGKQAFILKDIITISTKKNSVQ